MVLHNKKQRSRMVLSLGLTLWVASCSAVPEAEEFTPRTVEIPGLTGKIWQVHNFYLAAQPTVASLEALRGRGVRTVINLRGPDEAVDFDEPAVVQALGLGHVRIPVNPQLLDDAKIDEFIAAVKSSRRQTLIHCASAVRASALWAAYLGSNYGLSADRCIALAEQSGLKGDELKAAVRGYMERRQQKGEQAQSPTP